MQGRSVFLEVRKSIRWARRSPNETPQLGNGASDIRHVWVMLLAHQQSIHAATPTMGMELSVEDVRLAPEARGRPDAL